MMIVNNRLLLWMVAVGVTLLLLVGQCTRLQHQGDQITQTSSLLGAVTDSVQYYRDNLGRVVAEKLAIEADMATLDRNYKLLTRNQKALVQDIKHLPRLERKKLTTATSVVQKVSIDNHVNVDSSRVWTLDSDTLAYSIRTLGDALQIDSLRIPNRLLITQYRDSQGSLHVTARNTNPMISNQDVDSVIPPEKKRSKLVTILVLLGGVILGVAISR